MKNLLRILLALVATTTAVFAQTGTAIPGGNQSTTYVISKPGRYYLAANRVMTDKHKDAIQIASDDVTLDLNGATISFSDGTQGAGSAINGQDLQNLEIRGGSITSIPEHGIVIGSSDSAKPSSNIRIIDVRLSAVQRGAIWLHSDTVTIARCSIDEIREHGIYLVEMHTALVMDTTVVDCGEKGINASNGSTALAVKNCVVSQTNGAGISIPSGTVEGCLVFDCNKSQDLVSGGIVLRGPGSIRGNTVRNCHKNGIFADGIRVLVEENALLSGIGGAAIGGSPSAAGLYLNNRYTAGLATTNKLINGGGNIAF